MNNVTQMSAYQIRESKRARKIKLQISTNDGLVVVVPKGIRHEEVDILVRSQSQWINRNLDKLSARKQYLIRQFGEGLPNIISLPAINKCWKINYCQQAGMAGWTYSAFDHLNVYGNPVKAQKNIENWLTSIAREHLQEKLLALGNETGLTYKRIQIRAQKSRWGSCSARGTVSLNRNILFFAPEVVRYLLVHELCHTKYLNHSKKYWSLVEEYCPDYKISDKLLKEAWHLMPPWAVK